MIQLSTWRQAWFVTEYILILVAQLRILGLYTILPSGLTHNRPDQRTPRHTLRITTYQIYKCFCQHNVHFNTFSHLLSYDNDLLLAQHAITTFTHATVVRTRHRLLLHHFRLIAHTTVHLPNKAYQHDNQSNLLTGYTISENPFPVSRCFTIHPVHTVAMIL